MAEQITITRREAIDLMCKDCNYDPLDKGTWLHQVASCTSKSCPLYPYRPVPRGWEEANSPILPTYVRTKGRVGLDSGNLPTHRGKEK